MGKDENTMRKTKTRRSNTKVMILTHWV